MQCSSIEGATFCTHRVSQQCRTASAGSSREVLTVLGEKVHVMLSMRSVVSLKLLRC